MSAASALPHPPSDPELIEEAARRCRRVASWVDELATDVVGDASKLERTWAGPAAAACRAELERVVRLVGSLPEPLHDTAVLLLAHAARVAEARGDVDMLRVRYEEALLANQREMTALLARPGVPGVVRRLQVEDCRFEQAQTLREIHARHQDVLLDLAADAARTARRVVAVATRVVRRRPLAGRPVTDLEADIVAMLPLLRVARARAGVSSGPLPPGSAPRDARAWWHSLTSDEQDRLVGTWPRQLGGLDGLPAAARSRANGALLDREIAALLALGVRTQVQERSLDNCRVVLGRLTHLRKQVDPTTLEPMVVQLLVFEPAAFEAEGRVAIGIGDVDNADHVAVMVPGLGSDVRGYLKPLTENALRVTRHALVAAEAERTATVAWMGYDAPGFSKVADDDAAERGADLLAADLLALQGAREFLPHLTVVGHSYGSTTSGTALRDNTTGTDDVVLVGSPGAGVERAADLRVPTGHTFVGASSRDPVSYFDRFGADPAHESFGAFRFQAEDVTRNSWKLDVADHSKYFDSKTESLSNVVRVVVGDYDLVRRADYRGEARFRPDGIDSDPEADREPTVVP